MLKRLSIVLVCLVIVSATAWGQGPTTVYVSPSGDDGVGDGSIGNPFKTIQKGIDVAAAGDMVNVAASHCAP